MDDFGHRVLATPAHRVRQITLTLTLSRSTGRGNEPRTYGRPGVAGRIGQHFGMCGPPQTLRPSKSVPLVEQPPYACVYSVVLRVVSDPPGGLSADADLAGGAVPGKALPGENARRRAVEGAGDVPNTPSPPY